MSKLDELRRLAGGNAAESMSTVRPGAMHRTSPAPAAAQPERMQGLIRSKNSAEIPHDRIGPDPDQPREEFDTEALERLAESLKTKGQLQPIRVRWDEGRGQYVIICGERRWRAAGLAGLPTMQCVIADGPVEAGELLALQLIENCVREDLKPVEQARAFKALIARNGWSTRQVARELGVDQSSVVRALALLELPATIQDQVELGTLSPATAYEIGKLPDPVEQASVAARVVTEGLKRSEVMEAVRQSRPSSSKGRGGKAKPKKTTATLRAANGTKVTLENRRGVDDETIRAALVDALAQLDGRLESREQAA